MIFGVISIYIMLLILNRNRLNYRFPPHLCAPFSELPSKYHCWHRYVQTPLRSQTYRYVRNFTVGPLAVYLSWDSVSLSMIWTDFRVRFDFQAVVPSGKVCSDFKNKTYIKLKYAMKTFKRKYNIVYVYDIYFIYL